MMDLQFITHYTDTISYLDSVRIALEGGCRWVQLRMKGVSVDEMRPVAIEALSLCRKVGATFVIDDHVELALEIGADGVHLGKNDMPIAEARRKALQHLKGGGRGFIIGGTANTFEDVVSHWRNGADYIGCGPFRFTTTKEKLAPVLGLEGYRNIVSQMRVNGIDLPIVAIGGITAGDIPDIMATGVTGIAVSGTVLRAADPVWEMRKIKALLTSTAPPSPPQLGRDKE